MHEQPHIPWSDRYELGVAHLDAQHLQLVDLVNALARHADWATSAEKLLRLNYVLWLHFEAEERHMSEIRFAGIHQHRHEHAQFYLALRRLMGRGQEGFGDLLLALTQWLPRHLEDTARALAPKAPAVEDWASRPREHSQGGPPRDWRHRTPWPREVEHTA